MTLIQKVLDPLKQVTDSVLLSHLAKQGIEKDYVEFTQDYAPSYVNGKRVKGQSPYAKFYRDLKSNKRFMVVSGLPMVDADGVKIECGWRLAGINYFAEKNNLFRAKVQETQVELTIRNDQPDGRKAGDRLTFKPQLFLNGIEQMPATSALLPVDPVNPNYLENTLEWDYGICKRRLRIIEGRVLGSWVFASKPNGEVRIKYNQLGDYKLKLGQFAIDTDTEIIPASVFASAVYPFTVPDVATYYPDAHVETTSVDGYAERGAVAETWANIKAGAGNAFDDSSTFFYAVRIAASATLNLWAYNTRGHSLFDTSGLPDDAAGISGVLSLRGYAKYDGLGATPNINIYASTCASNTGLANADYGKVGATAFCDTPITYNNFTSAAFNDFTLNAAGIAAISKTGISKFAVRNANYDVAAATPPYVSDTSSYLLVYSSEQGNGYKPKLVVTYTIATVVTPTTLALTTTLYAPTVTASDNKVATPTTLALATTLYAPSVNIEKLVIPTTLALTITTYAPVLKLVVTPGTLASTLTPYAPSIVMGTVVTPTTLVLVLTTYTPGIFKETYRIAVDWDNNSNFTGTYDDITANVKSIQFSRGKSDELGKAEVGQCSITLNNSTGIYTPSLSTGVLYGLLLPKRPLRVRATYYGTTYNLFYGFIEEIVPHPHLLEQDCIITAVDGIDFLSRHDLATALYINTSTGTIHGYILDNAGWSASMRSLDTGQDTVPYWYGADVKARFAQEEIDDNEQGFSIVDGAGYFRFEDRHHRSTSTHQTSQSTFYNSMAGITYSMNPRNIYNEVKVTVTPWTIQAEAELWRLSEIPSIAVGQTLTWWGDSQYFVGAWVTPVATTDYTANSLANGSGTNLTANISIVTTKFAKTIKLVITNNGTVPAYITLLKARGTWYDDQTKTVRKTADATSQTAYQKRTFELDGKYMADADKAQDYADYAIGKYKDPRAQLAMTVMNQDATTLAQILSLEISDRVTVVNTKLGVNGDYFIDYMQHDISQGGLVHTVTYRLADCINEDFWCWDFSVWGVQTKWGY